MHVVPDERETSGSPGVLVAPLLVGSFDTVRGATAVFMTRSIALSADLRINATATFRARAGEGGCACVCCNWDIYELTTACPASSRRIHDAVACAAQRRGLRKLVRGAHVLGWSSHQADAPDCLRWLGSAWVWHIPARLKGNARFRRDRTDARSGWLRTLRRDGAAQRMDERTRMGVHPGSYEPKALQRDELSNSPTRRSRGRNRLHRQATRFETVSVARPLHYAHNRSHRAARSDPIRSLQRRVTTATPLP